jgi:hypothetical protein
VDVLREQQVDRHAHSHWGMRLPPHMPPGALRKALTALMRSHLSPSEIVIVLQAFGVVFEDKRLFTDKVEDFRIDPFRVIGMAVFVASLVAVAAVIFELAVSGGTL